MTEDTGPQLTVNADHLRGIASELDRTRDGLVRCLEKFLTGKAMSFGDDYTRPVLRSYLAELTSIRNRLNDLVSLPAPSETDSTQE